MHGGDRIAEVLANRGVRFVFTLCGGHISPILVGAKARGIRVVDVRDEATAVFAADAVSRLTGIPGVAAVTAGPGVTNVITAVKNAQLAQSPLIVLGGASATVLRGRGALQDIDQRALFAPHVKRCFLARRVRDLARMTAEAFDVAAGGVPGPVFVECPIDLLYPEEVVRPWYLAKSGTKQGASFAERAQTWYLERHLARMFARAGEPPPPSRADGRSPPTRAVARAAARLANAKRPVLVVGSPALTEAEHATEVARAIGVLGVPVWLSGMARGLLGPSHPLQRRHHRKEALREADLVILAGVPCDFRLDYGRHIRRGTPIVSIAHSRADTRKNRRPTLGVAGDPGAFLVALASAGVPHRWNAWLETLAARDAEREKNIAKMAMEPAPGGANPLATCRAIDAAIGDSSVVIGDGGDFVATASYTVRPRGPLSWLDPGPFGTLGCGAGFAIGAKLVRPDSEVWLLLGDGSAGYALSELDTFARHALGVIAVVGNDAAWSQIARDQIEILEDDVGTTLARADYEKVCEALGGAGFAAKDDASLPAALEAAKARAKDGVPVLVNVHLGKSEFRKGSISV